MSLFIRIFLQLIFWRCQLMILCNFRWDLANQCMPKWIETKRKTVEITVKILKWWCITVITVNTQTIGNSSNSCSSSSLHHNTFMDPQPPLQVTRGFENNFPWLPCAWFLHQRWRHTHTKKKLRFAQKHNQIITTTRCKNLSSSALHILIMKTTNPSHLLKCSNFPH